MGGFEGTTDGGGSLLRCFPSLGSHPSPLNPGQLTGRSHTLGVGGGGVWRILSTLWGLVPVFPHLLSLAGAGVSGWGRRQRKQDISCLADCAGLINVPEH